MENSLDDQVSIENVAFNDAIKKYMSQIRKWSLFLAITGTVVTSFILIALFAALFIVGNFPVDSQSSLPPGLILAIYMPLLLLYIIPINYAFRLAKHIKEALSTDHQFSYEQVMRYMKNLFAFFGWTTLVAVGLYAVALIGAGLAGALM